MQREIGNPGDAGSAPVEPKQRQRIIRSTTFLFAAAFLARLAFFLILFHRVPVQRIWDTGLETCHIAASLASGRGFSSPFGISTGASAWVPPAYATILAFFYRVFGPYSVAAAWSALLLNAVFAAATALAIFAAGEKILGTYVGAYVGTISAWIWALSPYTITMSLKVWETSISALLVMIGSLLYWRLVDSGELLDWAYWGLFWGCATLANPALSVFFPILSVGLGWRSRKRLAPRIALAVLVCGAIVAPWIARNYLQFRTLIPIRSNLGLELWLGNHEGVTGPNDESSHPLAVPRELAAYRDLGEAAYVAEKQRAALAFIRSHAGEFLRLTLWRIAYFWSSPRGSLWPLISACSFLGLLLAMRKDFLRSLPFAVALLIFPGAYYLTHADNWYRHPIEPLMTLLLVYALVTAARQLVPTPRKVTQISA